MTAPARAMAAMAHQPCWNARRWPREQYRDPGQRSRLAEKGADLFPALAALMQWGDKWLSASGGPIELQHRDCGEPVAVELRCTAGHPVSPVDLDLMRRK